MKKSFSFSLKEFLINDTGDDFSELRIRKDRNDKLDFITNPKTSDLALFRCTVVISHNKIFNMSDSS